MNTTTVVRHGVKLAVRDWGGDERALVMLHGLASSSHIFDLMTPKLVGDFRVVAYDQRGHGESTKPSSGYGFDQMTADAVAVIEQLELEAPLVVGHSWGANVALELGVRRPDLASGLVLLDGGFISMRERMDWKTARQMLAPPPIAGIHIDEYLSMVRGFMDLEWTSQVESVFRSLMRVDQEGRIRPRLSRNNHLRILRALWEQDTVGLLRRVQVRTLVIATRQRNPSDGDAMFIAAKEEAVKAVRGVGDPVRFEWIESIHDVPLQKPDELASRIRAFARETG